MVKCDCLVDSVIEMVLLRCALMATGETSVTITGTVLMQQCSAGNFLERIHVSIKLKVLLSVYEGIIHLNVNGIIIYLLVEATSC